jgi:hypothetical protein
MVTPNEQVNKYHQLIIDENLEQAYRIIMTTMSQLKVAWDSQYPHMLSGSLYQGFMDMTFISVKPVGLSELDLKVSIVYLHQSNTFEGWLVARNRKLQSETHQKLQKRPLGKYFLTILEPGVDAIIATPLIEQPNFDDPKILIDQLIENTLNFIGDMQELVR